MSSPEEDPGNLNGLILQSHYIPEEVISLILSYVDPNSLAFRCRRVCKMWKQLIDEEVWKIRLRSAQQHSLSKLSYTERMTLKLPWYVYYIIFTADPFEKNLIKNHCSQENMKYWKSSVYDSYGRDDINRQARRSHSSTSDWLIESVPIGCDPLPKHEDFGDHTSCFATSHRLIDKFQIVSLKDHRILKKIIDEFQPTITASEWYAGRFDCGCVYQLTVSLLDKDKNIICIKESPVKRINQWEGREWEKVELTFDNYGPNVRYIEFRSFGKDTQFWAGHYGSKMSGAVLKISLPKPKNSNSD